MENRDSTVLEELKTALRELAETVDRFAQSERESYQDRKRLAKQLSDILFANKDGENRIDFGYGPYVTAIGIGFGACSIVNRLKKQDLMVDEYKMLEDDESAVDGILGEANSYDKLMLISCLGGNSGDLLIHAVEQALKKKATVVAVFATIPFRFEGLTRMEKAKRDLETLRGLTQYLYVFSNDEYKRKSVSFEESFERIAQAIGEKINEAVVCS